MAGQLRGDDFRDRDERDMLSILFVHMIESCLHV